MNRPGPTKPTTRAPAPAPLIVAAESLPSDHITENFLEEMLPPSVWTALESTFIRDLRWTARASRVLEEAQCRTLADICRQRRDWWTGRRTIGRRTIQELEAAVRSSITTFICANPHIGLETRIASVRTALRGALPLTPALWSSIVADLRPSPLADLTMLAACERIGATWPRTRPTEQLRDFLTDSLAALLGHPGFGRMKAHRLQSCILQLWLLLHHANDAAVPSMEETAASIEQKLRAGDLRAALKEAFAFCRLDARSLQVLSVRFGLSGRPPRTLGQCGKQLRFSVERIRQIQTSACTRLAIQPELLAVFRHGLAALEPALRRRLPMKFGSLHFNSLHSRATLYQALGSWESLLITVCHGSLANWLRRQPPKRSQRRAL